MGRPTPPPMDCVGNELKKDDLIAMVFTTMPIFKVLAVEQGGIHTTNGITPTVVRVYCDITLRQTPGVPFSSIAKITQPDAQALVQAISDSLSKG